MSFGLPRPLRTAFKLKLVMPMSSVTPDAATRTLHALNWLKGKEHQNQFSNFPKKQTKKLKEQIWGWIGAIFSAFEKSGRIMCFKLVPP